MRNGNDAVRQENRKALPKFALIMVCRMALGAVLGISRLFVHPEDLDAALTAAGTLFPTKLAGWLVPAVPVVELAVCLPLYFEAKRRLAAWDGEDEEASSRIEMRVCVCMWIAGLSTVLAFFLLAALLSGFAAMDGDPMRVTPALFFGGLGGFIAQLAVNMVLQQKLVDLTKRLNPEKHGSVYDVKFQKTWYESCDEAERLLIGQCALKAYQAMCTACLALWVALTLGGMFFRWGFLPAMAVCIVWGAGQSVYCYWCVKLAKPGGTM